MSILWPYFCLSLIYGNLAAAYRLKYALNWRVSTWLSHPSWLNAFAPSDALPPQLGSFSSSCFPLLIPACSFLRLSELKIQGVASGWRASSQCRVECVWAFEGRGSASPCEIQCLGRFTLSPLKGNKIPLPHLLLNSMLIQRGSFESI